MQVKWSRKALSMFGDVLEQGRAVFGEQTAMKLSGRAMQLTGLLESNPLMGKVEPGLAHRRHEYRSVMLNHRFKLVYHVRMPVKG